MAASATDVVSVAEAKEELRLQDNSRDSLVESHIASAVSFISELLEAPLVDRIEDFQADIPAPNDPIRVRVYKPRMITSLKYWGPADSMRVAAPQTLTGYGVLLKASKDTASRYLIYPPEAGWPDTLQGSHFAIRIKRGMDATDGIKQAVLIGVSNLFDGFPLSESDSIIYLIAPYRRGDA